MNLILDKNNLNSKWAFIFNPINDLISKIPVIGQINECLVVW